MFYVSFLVVIVILYMICDLNYVLRTYFSVWSGRLYQRKYSLTDVTTTYGMGTFQDCDVCFQNIRMARLVRELDFARYHFYDRTGIYHRSRKLGIKSLQGSTLTIYVEPVPIFKFYKINTKLVYWDERSLFLEHEVVTLHDNKVCCLLVSRQFAIGKNKETTPALLQGLPRSDMKPRRPEYITTWLQSMLVSSSQLRGAKNV